MKLFELFQGLFEDLTENIIRKILKNDGLVNKIAAAANKDNAYASEVLPSLTSQQTQTAEQPSPDLNKIICQDILTRIAEADPNKPTHLEWLAAKYAAQQFRIEDISNVRSGLETFFRVRDQLPQKNLFAIQSIGQLYELIEPFRQVSQEQLNLSNLVKKVKAAGGQILFNDGKVVVIKLTDFRNSVVFADITQWCTTQKKNWESYTASGPLYVIATALPDGLGLWQFHYKDNDTIEFKNKNDVDVKSKDIAMLSKSQAYTDFLNYLIKLHYGKYFTNGA